MRATSQMKVYNKAYFDHFYRDPVDRVSSRDGLERKVRLAVSVAEFLLVRPIRTVLDVGCGEAPWQPVLKHERVQLVKPGEIVAVEIEILPSSTRFEAGEGLRLVISGKDVFSNAMHHHRESCNSGRHTIYTGGKYDSHLLLPVIPPQK